MSGDALEYSGRAWSQIAEQLAPGDVERQTLIRAAAAESPADVRAEAALDAMDFLRRRGPARAAAHFREVLGGLSRARNRDLAAYGALFARVADLIPAPPVHTAEQERHRGRARR